MQNYQNFMSPSANIQMSPQYKGNVDTAISGYGDFARTGGFTPQGLQDIRARSIAPTRAVYQQGMDQLAREKALTGAASAPTAIGRMAREQAAAVGDTNVNANAAIAQMVQQGQLAGLGGLANTAYSQEEMQRQIDMANIQRQLQGAQGMAQLYGTTPGMANMFGNQVLQSTQQGIDTEKLQQQIAQMIIQGQLGRANMPTRWDAFKSFGQGLAGIRSGLQPFPSSGGG